ncbi:hypothetical protein M231_02829 [Tremella mesenterica]|uniref:Uncharacterized protein n=1 Tax=Tremella mesenterica TaxID=5217 RepID=A0A4Q1BPQ3_TREME|nr:hypothetical protein M231_02829 [Tremella mesenterica]
MVFSKSLRSTHNISSHTQPPLPDSSHSSRFSQKSSNNQSHSIPRTESKVNLSVSKRQPSLVLNLHSPSPPNNKHVSYKSSTVLGSYGLSYEELQDKGDPFRGPRPGARQVLLQSEATDLPRLDSVRDLTARRSSSRISSARRDIKNSKEGTSKENLPNDPRKDTSPRRERIDEKAEYDIPSPSGSAHYLFPTIPSVTSYSAGLNLHSLGLAGVGLNVPYSSQQNLVGLATGSVRSSSIKSTTSTILSSSVSSLQPSRYRPSAETIQSSGSIREGPPKRPPRSLSRAAQSTPDKKETLEQVEREKGIVGATKVSSMRTLKRQPSVSDLLVGRKVTGGDAIEGGGLRVQIENGWQSVLGEVPNCRLDNTGDTKTSHSELTSPKTVIPPQPFPQSQPTLNISDSQSQLSYLRDSPPQKTQATTYHTHSQPQDTRDSRRSIGARHRSYTLTGNQKPSHSQSSTPSQISPQPQISPSLPPVDFGDPLSVSVLIPSPSFSHLDYSVASSSPASQGQGRTPRFSRHGNGFQARMSVQTNGANQEDDSRSTRQSILAYLRPKRASGVLDGESRHSSNSSYRSMKSQSSKHSGCSVESGRDPRDSMSMTRFIHSTAATIDFEKKQAPGSSIGSGNDRNASIQSYSPSVEVERRRVEQGLAEGIISSVSMSRDGMTNFESARKIALEDAQRRLMGHHQPVQTMVKPRKRSQSLSANRTIREMSNVEVTPELPNSLRTSQTVILGPSPFHSNISESHPFPPSLKINHPNSPARSPRPMTVASSIILESPKPLDRTHVLNGGINIDLGSRYGTPSPLSPNNRFSATSHRYGDKDTNRRPLHPALAMEIPRQSLPASSTIHNATQSPTQTAFAIQNLSQISILAPSTISTPSADWTSSERSGSPSSLPSSLEAEAVDLTVVPPKLRSNWKRPFSNHRTQPQPFHPHGETDARSLTNHRVHPQHINHHTEKEPIHRQNDGSETGNDFGLDGRDEIGDGRMRRSSSMDRIKSPKSVIRQSKTMLPGELRKAYAEASTSAHRPENIQPQSFSTMELSGLPPTLVREGPDPVHRSKVHDEVEYKESPRKSRPSYIQTKPSPPRIASSGSRKDLNTKSPMVPNCRESLLGQGTERRRGFGTFCSPPEAIPISPIYPTSSQNFSPDHTSVSDSPNISFTRNQNQKLSPKNRNQVESPAQSQPDILSAEFGGKLQDKQSPVNSIVTPKTTVRSPTLVSASSLRRVFSKSTLSRSLSQVFHTTEKHEKNKEKVGHDDKNKKMESISRSLSQAFDWTDKSEKKIDHVDKNGKKKLETISRSLSQVFERTDKSEKTKVDNNSKNEQKMERGNKNKMVSLPLETLKEGEERIWREKLLEEAVGHSYSSRMIRPMDHSISFETSQHLENSHFSEETKGSKSSPQPEDSRRTKVGTYQDDSIVYQDSPNESTVGKTLQHQHRHENEDTRYLDNTNERIKRVVENIKHSPKKRLPIPIFDHDLSSHRASNEEEDVQYEVQSGIKDRLSLRDSRHGNEENDQPFVTDKKSGLVGSESTPKLNHGPERFIDRPQGDTGREQYIDHSEFDIGLETYINPLPPISMASTGKSHYLKAKHVNLSLLPFPQLASPNSSPSMVNTKSPKLSNGILKALPSVPGLNVLSTLTKASSQHQDQNQDHSLVRSQQSQPNSSSNGKVQKLSVSSQILSSKSSLSQLKMNRKTSQFDPNFNREATSTTSGERGMDGISRGKENQQDDGINRGDLELGKKKISKKKSSLRSNKFHPAQEDIPPLPDLSTMTKSMFNSSSISQSGYLNSLDAESECIPSIPSVQSVSSVPSIPPVPSVPSIIPKMKNDNHTRPTTGLGLGLGIDLPSTFGQAIDREEIKEDKTVNDEDFEGNRGDGKDESHSTYHRSILPFLSSDPSEDSSFRLGRKTRSTIRSLKSTLGVGEREKREVSSGSGSVRNVSQSDGLIRTGEVDTKEKTKENNVESHSGSLLMEGKNPALMESRNRSRSGQSSVESKSNIDKMVEGKDGLRMIEGKTGLKRKNKKDPMVFQMLSPISSSTPREVLEELAVRGEVEGPTEKRDRMKKWMNEVEEREEYVRFEEDVRRFVDGEKERIRRIGGRVRGED